MATGIPPSSNYPVRLGRRLSVALALIVVIMLCAGAISVHLGTRINQINEAIDQEHAHALAAGEIHGRFHHLISEIRHIQATGRFERAPRVRDLQQGLARAIRAFMDVHRAEEQSPDEALEGPILDNLARLEADLGALSERSAMVFGERKLLSPAEMEQLSDLMNRLMQNGEELSRFHRKLVIRLSTESQRLDRLGVRTYLAFLVIGGLLVGLASFVLQRKLATPLARLSRAALEIGDGHLEDRVPVTTRDEIGQLSHAFNVMAEGLETRERELRSTHAHLERKLREAEVLNQISSEMVAFTGPETILQSIVDKAREILYVDAAAICLTAADSGELKVSATSGPAEAFRAEVTMVHRSAGEARGTVHSLAECPAMHSERIRSHVAFPLKRGRASIGVLCVGSREERSFSAEEQGLLSALAAQATVTVEHGRLDAQVRGFAVEEERGRIARDMHDGLAQSVSLLHLKARQAQVLLTAGKSSQAADTLGELADISASAYDEVRQSIFGLRTMVSGGLGIIPALTELLHEFSERNDLPVTLEADGAEPVRLSPASEFQLIRIVQEALTNIRKHAHAQNARVCVERQDSWVRITIEDNGSGFDPAKVTSPNGLHFGLQGMRERAERLGGTLEIVTVPDRGTRVTASLPLESA